MPELRIRPAVESDWEIVLDLIRQLADYEKLAHTVTATPERLRQTLFGPRPAAEVALAYQGDDSAGFAVYFSTYSTFLAKPGLYLEDLFVKPHLRGQGIGLALFRHLARIAVERDCGRMEWTALDWNEPAIRFYTGLGAKPLDEWIKFRLTDEALKKAAG